MGATIDRIVLQSTDAEVQAEVARTSTRVERPHVHVHDARELVKHAPRALVLIDRKALDPRALEDVFSVEDRGPIVIIARDDLSAVSDADVVAHASVLRDVIEASVRDSAASNGDGLLAVSLLAGQLDQTIERAAQRVAAAFAVERCRILLPQQIVAGARGAVIDRTETHIRAGCIELGTSGVRVLDAGERGRLDALAARFGQELSWRGVYERTAEELDRMVNNPGVDALLGVWNRSGLLRLATMYLSTASRLKQSLGAILVDVANLQRINSRHGLEVGDRVLRRVADAMRGGTRIEDVVGRWSGGKLVVLLQNSTLEGAERVADRITAALEARPLKVGEGELTIQTRFGVCLAQQNEDPPKLIERAAMLAKTGAGTVRPSQRRLPSLDGDDVASTLGGTFRLLHEIGQGAMGLVYRAEDLALERPVAIKMLRPDLAADVELVEQLRSEAALLARLQHPNLVQVYSFGHGGGDAYIVMELVEGEPLQQAVERHRNEHTTIPMQEVIAIVESIGSALDALHEVGVIHRDVKPANVIRDPFRGRSVLVDVGIARRFGQSVETAGTPGYVAPEVIRGEPASNLSDVYGLAATVYTLLTLQLPWGDVERISVLSRQLEGEELPLVSTHRPELAPADEILRAALSADPKRRPRSAGAFARALSTAIAGLSPIPSDRANSIGRLILPRRTQATLAKTRGVVFRSVGRALGLREAERLRDRLAADHPDIARAITEAAPLDWLPTELFTRLLSVAPQLAARDANLLARDVARATVRASFRRFFPASAATLIPERTLSAMRTVWSRYQTWGSVSAMPVQATEVVIKIADTPRVADLCAFASGMFEQLVVLSGGHATHVEHESCEARGDQICLYRVSWERS